MSRRGPGLVVLRRTARLASRSGLLWGTLFGVLIANEALSYHRSFPTATARATFARTFGDNAGLAAVTGRAHRLDTVEGFLAWRMFGLLLIVGAVWGVLTATRLTRAEEESGRWDLLLSGRTSRSRATAQAIGGLGLAYGALFAATAALTVAAGLRPSVGFSVAGSLYFALAATASAAMFLGVGVLAGQLTSTRRAANGIGLGVLGAAFVVRLAADAVPRLGWLRWLSPLGWVENLQPLTAPRPAALVPIAALTLATVIMAVRAAGGRDVGPGLWTRDDPPRPGRHPLRSPLNLAVRLERRVWLAWVLTVGLLAVVFGVVARSAAEAALGDQAVAGVVGAAAAARHPAAAWVAYELLYLSALIGFAAVNQVSALREEEMSGRLDHLVSARVGRERWLGGRLALAAGMVVACGLVAGLGAWCGLLGYAGRPSLVALLLAGLNICVPALVVLGIGTLLYGLTPAHTPALLGAVVLWSFLVEVLGTSLTSDRRVLDLSLLAPLDPAPAVSPDGSALLALLLAAGAAAAGGVVALRRRDLATG